MSSMFILLCWHLVSIPTNHLHHVIQKTPMLVVTLGGQPETKVGMDVALFLAPTSSVVNTTMTAWKSINME